MKAFLARFGCLVRFVLSGFDRLRFAGESRLLNHQRGVQSYCHQQRLLFKDFPAHAEQRTRTFRQRTPEQLGDIPLLHRNIPDVDKEALGLDLAQHHGRTSGRIAVLTCQESATAYGLRRNAEGLVEPRKETTINDPSGYRVWRTKEGEAADAAKSWQRLRKGVADLPRRAEVSAAANHRLAESLATVAEPAALGALLTPLGRLVLDKGRRRARPLNPLAGADGALLRALADGNYLIHGVRNRDLRVALFGAGAGPEERRRQAAQVTRRLALLRAHGLLVKVQTTHRYQLSALGRRVCAALAAAHATSVNRRAEAA
jgi:hypothetical protein